MGTVADSQVINQTRRMARRDAQRRFLWRVSMLAPDIYRAIDRDDVAPFLRDTCGSALFVRTDGGVTDDSGCAFPDFAPALVYDFVWTLKYPTYIYGRDRWGNERDFGVFDPRSETVDAAVFRLLPELKRRLRRSLEYMNNIDAGIEAAPLLRRPPDRHFDWLIRYQLLGESMPGISKLDEVDRRAVSRGIHGTADLIGLALRDPSPAGRPRTK